MRASRTVLLAALAVVLAAPARSQARAQATPEPPTSPSVGATFPVFDAQALDGSTKRVDFPKGSTTILLFFSSGCPTCHRMIPEWNRAYEKRPKGLTILAVIVDKEPPGFFMATPISFPVVRAPGNDFLPANRVNRVPLTLRITAGGRIEDLGLGMLDPIRLGELFRAAS
jgi:thiol-disulfide isomerase/thioredoxin